MLLAVRISSYDALGKFGENERSVKSCASSNSYASLVLFKLPKCIITRKRKHASTVSLKNALTQCYL